MPKLMTKKNTIFVGIVLFLLPTHGYKTKIQRDMDHFDWEMRILPHPNTEI